MVKGFKEDRRMDCHCIHGGHHYSKGRQEGKAKSSESGTEAEPQKVNERRKPLTGYNQGLSSCPQKPSTAPQSLSDSFHGWLEGLLI